MEEAKLFSADSHVNEPRKLGREYPNGCVNMGLILSRIRRAKRALHGF